MDRINVCPDHVLIQVFENLSSKMIKTCSIVCKRWNEIVGTSSVLMDRFQLNLNKKPYKIEEAKLLQRKHRSVIAWCSDSSLDDCLDVMCQHKLQSLELRENNGTKLSLLVKTLNELKSLKVFNANYSQFIDDLSESSDNMKTISTKIEQLKCVVGIIHIFTCCSVKKLSLACLDTIDDNRKGLVIEFLKNQNSLEDLDLFGEAIGELFALPDIFDLKCSLKTFKYSNGLNNFPYYDEFIRFLSQHVMSLRSLEMDFFTDPQYGLELVLRYALMNIVNLKHIKINFFNDHRRISLSKVPPASQITRNLESLDICGLSNDMKTNQQFFDLLPNLKHLNFRSTDDDESDSKLLICISERCTKLESLKVSTTYETGIFFPGLKEFTIKQWDDSTNFCAFINQHSPTLERITIENYDIITRSVSNAIMKCRNLYYLKMYLNNVQLESLLLLDRISGIRKPFTLMIPKKNGKYVLPDDYVIYCEREI